MIVVEFILIGLIYVLIHYWLWYRETKWIVDNSDLWHFVDINLFNITFHSLQHSDEITYYNRNGILVVKTKGDIKLIIELFRVHFQFGNFNPPSIVKFDNRVLS